MEETSKEPHLCSQLQHGVAPSNAQYLHGRIVSIAFGSLRKKNRQHYVGQLQYNLIVYTKPSQRWATRRKTQAVSLTYIYFHEV